MKVLLDECVNRPVAREIADHDVSMAVRMGWGGIKNGKLLFGCGRGVRSFCDA
jgi:hypothetical protein